MCDQRRQRLLAKVAYRLAIFSRYGVVWGYWSWVRLATSDVKPKVCLVAVTNRRVSLTVELVLFLQSWEIVLIPDDVAHILLLQNLARDFVHAECAPGDGRCIHRRSRLQKLRHQVSSHTDVVMRFCR